MNIVVYLGANEGNDPALKQAVRDDRAGRCPATDETENGGISMNPFSVLMFCFSGALFLYAVLLYGWG